MSRFFRLSLRKANPYHDERGRFTFAPFDGRAGSQPTLPGLNLEYPPLRPIPEKGAPESGPTATRREWDTWIKEGLQKAGVHPPQGVTSWAKVPEALRYNEELWRHAVRRFITDKEAKTLNGLAEETRSAFRSWVNSAEFRVRVPIATLEDVVRTGRLLNQHEAERSNGYYSPEIRKGAEEYLFGYDRKDTPANNRPVYGYASSRELVPGTVEYEQEELDHYGEVVLVLKDEVKERSTIMAGDSLASYTGVDHSLQVPFSRGLPTLARDPQVSGLPPDPDFWQTVVEGENDVEGTARDSLPSGYMEFQYHGELSLDLVKEVVITTYEGPEPWFRDSINALEGRGIRVRFVSD